MGTLVSAHETLRQAGITPEQIHLVMNDTKVTPNSGPAGGSRSQVMTGNACRLAAENLLAAMKKDDGTYRTYDEMVAEGIETKVLVSGLRLLAQIVRSTRQPLRAILSAFICTRSSCQRFALIQKPVR